MKLFPGNRCRRHNEKLGVRLMWTSKYTKQLREKGDDDDKETISES